MEASPSYIACSRLAWVEQQDPVSIGRWGYRGNSLGEYLPSTSELWAQSPAPYKPGSHTCSPSTWDQKFKASLPIQQVLDLTPITVQETSLRKSGHVTYQAPSSHQVRAPQRCLPTASQGKTIISSVLVN